MEKKDLKNNKPVDGIGESQPIHFWAGVWLVSALVVGVLLVSNLARVDAFMYQTGGDLLDYDQYRENRNSQSSIGSEIIDQRTKNATYSQVAE